MARYALLLKASANRVYGESTFTLAQAELAAFDQVLAGVVAGVERAAIGGVDYLVADTARPLSPADVAVLSNLSALHALFEVDAEGRFCPAAVAPRRVLDEDVVTIQRYAGKTNEAFTHLLVNVALAASGDAVRRLLQGDRLRLLDPVCGRGTSLNRAALYGMDACGVDLDERDVDALRVFITTWLKGKRLKHSVATARLRKGRPVPAHRVTITYGEGRDRSAHHVIDVVHDDTVRARDHFPARSMDLVVGDLPYGVQHGSRPDAASLDRAPERLLEAALPVWLDLLKPGSAAAFAWNRRTLPRPALVRLAEAAGFVVRDPDSDAFVHRVDRSITRDVLVATRSD